MKHRRRRRKSLKTLCPYQVKLCNTAHKGQNGMASALTYVVLVQRGRWELHLFRRLPEASLGK